MKAMELLPPADTMYRALVNRDPSFEGIFFVGVRTTGIFCRPMDPRGRPPKLIEQLRTEVERAPGGRLTDKELAALSIDPSTARRQFKRHYGMTFHAYHRARRMGL